MRLKTFLEKAKVRRKGKNKELLMKVAQRLRKLRHEEHYNQGDWIQKTSCGTTACIAGHTVIEAGLTPMQAIKFENDYLETGLDIAGAAKNLLGLTDSEAGVLFNGGPGSVWPGEFGQRWNMAVYHYGEEEGERPSRIAADFIEAIVKGKVKL